MTNNSKTCPFMNRPVVLINEHGYQYIECHTFDCVKEKCAAWGAKFNKNPNCHDGDWIYGCRLIP